MNNPSEEQLEVVEATAVNVLTGRDPRRFFSERDRTIVRTRQLARCGVCTTPLPEDFHMHHVVEWANGGPTTPENALAVCADCHRDAPVDDLPVFVPRQWQETAAGIVHPILRTSGFATVAAAPGAGKTPFGAYVASGLGATGHIDRLIVFAPSRAVKRQWRKEFAKHGIRLDDDPRYGEERRGYGGMIITYGALINPDTIDAIRASVTSRTLLIFDECHHLATDDDGGDPAAWARAVQSIAGTPDSPLCPVLNLSGTPFRSRRDQRVATLRYTPVPGDASRIQLDPDFEIPASELISAGQLRHIDLLSFAASVETVDLSSGSVTSSGSIVDLSDQGDNIRSAALSALLRDETRFIGPVVDQLLDTMRSHTHVLGAPVKGLIVADDAAHADQIGAHIAGKIPGHVYVAHSKNADPHAELEAFSDDPETAVLVSVRMASEGFDCPQVSCVVHATRWSAPLFVTQVTGRCMRVTDTERAAGIVLPATVIVPADPRIVTAYRDVLTDVHRVLDVKQVCATCNRRPCVCRPSPRDRQCQRCSLPWMLCACDCLQCGGKRRDCGCSRATAATVGARVITDAELHEISHDGDQIALDLLATIDWAGQGLPAAFTVTATAAVQRSLNANPLDLAAAMRSATPQAGE